MQNVRDDIFRKPKGCKKQSRYRQGAGIYVYPIEEFGKLLLLKKATAIGGMLQPKGKSSKASDRQVFYSYGSRLKFQCSKQACKKKYDEVYDEGNRSAEKVNVK